MRIYSVTYLPVGAPKNATLIIAANSEKEAFAQVIPKGVPVAIELASGRTKVKISRDYKQQFLTAILFHVEAGLSAGKALEEIIKSEQGAIRPQLNPALYILEGGGSFPDAMLALDMYDSATIAVLRSGEQVGAMGSALRSAAEHYEKVGVSKGALYGVMMVLLVDVISSISSVFGVQFGLLPYIKQQGVSGVSAAVKAQFEFNLMLAYWGNGIFTVITVIGVLIAAFFAFAYMQKENAALREWVERKIATLPLIGAVFAHSGLSMTFSMCATLLKGAVPLTAGIRIIKDVALSPMVADYWSTSGKKLEMGEPVALALNHPILDKAETLVLGAHKSSTQLAEAFNNIAKRRDQLSVKANKKFMMVAVAGGFGYSLVSLMFAGFAAYIQYNAAMSSIMGVGTK